ncbi:putative cysteine desulfurase [Polaribacter huanghezhanensis]|uniref:aminotransferase class V-fold PLP-dependent enzyme n=1 Tax=Polaribacter huanghezhanensis TaxID=1354726 RepID=UPI002646FD28|nr:aminotransferase class V-fold PLP-dependent enzyme [Polaribacter huanghezhanensis]WKD86331.1 putative cysteine desulfurase [Polaribacter huanghezhanensis]
MKNQKHLFDIPEGIHYLNTASLSASFKSVEEAGMKALKEKSKPYLIPVTDFFNPVITLKKLFAQLIDADDYNRIATIPSVSYGLSTVANNIKLNKGDEIVLIEEQFPSNYYVWEKLAKKHDALLKIVQQPTMQENKGKRWNEAILNSINDNTAFIALGNIHWTNGTIFDLKAIRKKTTEHNALLIVDGSQSVGAMEFSIKEIQPDALICAGYKWLFGPYGCGYAYFGAYFDDGEPIEENWSNRFNSENLSDLVNYEPRYKALANRYSVGEHASFIYVKMQIAALEQIIEWTPKAIQEYCKGITSDFVDVLKEKGCIIENFDDRAHHLFGVEIPEKINKAKLKETLSKNNVFVSFRGNYIRVSCHLFNTSKDLKVLSDCILAAL